MMRRSWRGWKRESNGGTKSFEWKWGSHFNNVLSSVRRVCQIDSLIFFFPEVVLSDQVLRFHQWQRISRPSFLAQCYPLLSVFCIMSDIWYATCMLCSNLFLLHTLTINGVFHEDAKPRKFIWPENFDQGFRVYLASERWCDSFQLSSSFVSAPFTMLDYATIRIGYMLSNTMLYILPQSWSAKILAEDFANERTRRIKRNFSKRVTKLYCLS